MAIKNWTVTVESVRSVLAREHYLNNSKHQNHSKTELIVDIWGSKETSLNIDYQCEKRKLQQALKRKGGRPPTPAMEFVFTLPKGLRPSEQQWKFILKHVVLDISKAIDIPVREFNGIVRAVLHKQQQDMEKGSGDHLHVIIGKFTNGGYYLRELQKKGVIHTSKQSFNAQVKSVLGVSYLDYLPEKNFDKVAKKRAPQWKVKAVRQRESHRANVKIIQRNLETFLKQCKKWLDAYDIGNKTQMNRQYNRLLKSISTLEAHSFLYDNHVTLRLLNSMIATINSRTDRADLPKITSRL
ncbi:hypothetical protein BCT06_12680 [Vibrio breoganii]|uniref:hypothetical protein n=1 Tax=Vibrio breoganii TaxID=553239 RepID=UPI000C8239E7|nr:hypothetical protein [Vibrio breoganii]PMO60345.1 hypothetical protein BCT06_12680 [Vibrio breoganii]